MDAVFYKRIETPGLAHWSYMVGDGGELVVIDPRRDIGIYLEIAREAKMRITSILETHRNEDYIIGSRELAEATGATVYISSYEDLGFDYATFIKDKDYFKLGNLTVEALHTPGHTLGHMSYVLYIGEHPYMVFTGDSLFAGDVGRTDFYGAHKLDEMTGMLYDSIFTKLFSLGDHVLVCPAHGAGSACGTAIEDRPFSTIGYERQFNPKLQYTTKKDFIANVGKTLPKPPYFEKMEACNVQGASYLGSQIEFSPIILDRVNIDQFEGQVIDVREEGAFYSSHFPGSLCIPKGSLASYLGWLVNVDTPIYFLTNDYTEEALSYLYLTSRRMGFDQVKGFLSRGISGWEISGGEIHTMNTIDVRALKKKISGGESPVIIDVRKKEELTKTDALPGSINIPLHDIPSRVEEISAETPIFVLCASGVRSAIAASYLKKVGRKPTVILGGLEAWNAQAVLG